jgi:diketogulonate reductase-like aldo/keto reductase
LYQKELLDYCNDKKIIFQAYSSLGAREGWKILSQNETLIKIASKYNKSVPQILLKWGLQHGVCELSNFFNLTQVQNKLFLKSYHFLSLSLK